MAHIAAGCTTLRVRVVGQCLCEGSSLDFSPRTAGMSLSGLMLTFPGGYLLYQMGYNYQYALSGGKMMARSTVV